MSGVLRSGALRLIKASQGTKVSAQSLLKNAVPAVQQAIGIAGKAMRSVDTTTKKPAPYDYKNKNYTYSNALFDKTTQRFDENSKIIVVEGSVAAGKSKFAAELAADLDMLYVPEANMDLVYINSYGYDMRKLDDQLPESSQSYDVKNFLQNPNHLLAPSFQLRMYQLRYIQYIDALAHVMSTGQGVVLDRSCFSDYVFVEAMHRAKYISDGAKSVYYDIRKNTIDELFKPHLVIYLDVPVDVIKQRVKARKLPGEADSKVLNDEYLANLDYYYKQQFLKDISASSELLVYDWSNGGDSEIVVEDIERIDFNRFEKHDKKLKQWRLPKEWDWCEARMRFTSEKPELMSYFNVPRYDVPELLRSADDAKLWREVWFSAPGMEYAVGYNAEMGDTNILTKTTLPMNL